MKIKKIKIINDEKLGTIELDFTKNGVIQDTIIFAGNNGCGKTTILESLLLLAESGRACSLDKNSGSIEAIIVLSDEELDLIKDNIINDRRGMDSECGDLTNEMEFIIDFTGEQNTYGRLKLYAINEFGKKELDSYNVLNKGKLERIISSFYSSANIDYVLEDINNITTIDIDKSEFNTIKSSNNTGNQIKQTFIDIYNLDAQDFQEWANENKGKIIDENMMFIRLRRFKDAFKYIMDDLEFDKIVNTPNKKEVMFKRKGKNIKIDNLSTGEKQIVIRGGFLLRFLRILKGSIILIDEPELSLHPDWQNKILQFYKKLFIDENGNQTSQIFVATHSPFIINNSSRYNDKVIVLNRNETTGNIQVVNNPTYYNCNNNVYIQDAFDVNDFDKEKNILFTEGETDEKYLKRAIEIFFNNKVSFDVKWIGKKLDQKNVINTGYTGLNNLLRVLEANENLFTQKVGLLYDSDTNKNKISNKKYFTYTLNNIKNKIYEIGIENLLELPNDFEYSDYLMTIQKKDKYGAISKIQELDKIKLCEDICNSENANIYLKELKSILQDINNIMEE